MWGALRLGLRLKVPAFAGLGTPEPYTLNPTPRPHTVQYISVHSSRGKGPGLKEAGPRGRWESAPLNELLV